MKFKRTKRQTLFGTLVKFKRLVPSNEYYMELLEMKGIKCNMKLEYLDNK